MWGVRFGIARALLKFANLGPAMHAYALQCSNWICIRLPQISRANLSAWFILCRRAASIAYLKSFGCLVRLTVPHARREGDGHFADRGMLGIYLGPSEQSPGCVVYVPATRKFYVSRDIIAYEDVHPGVKHVEASWAQLSDTEESTTAPSQLDTFHPTTTVEAATRESIEAQLLTQFEVDDPVGLSHEFADRSSSEPPVSEPVASASVPEQQVLTSHDTTQPTPAEPVSQSDPSLDPSSRRFKRVLPDRSTRYRGTYTCSSLIDPTLASQSQSIENIC